MSEIDDIIEKIKNDPCIIKKLDINELLKQQNMDISFFANMLKTNIQILQNLYNDEHSVKLYLNKLTGYVFVEDLYLFKIGRFIRWFNKKRELKNGGILTDIVFNNNGTNLICKNNRNNVFQIKLNDNIFFQKLSDEEQFILSVYEYAC